MIEDPTLPNNSSSICSPIREKKVQYAVEIHDPYLPNSRLGTITGPYFVGGLKPPSP